MPAEILQHFNKGFLQPHSQLDLYPEAIFHLENILMAEENGDVKQLFSNTAKSWLFCISSEFCLEMGQVFS